MTLDKYLYYDHNGITIYCGDALELLPVMDKIDLTIPQGAIFSEDGKYRYTLWRIWSQVRPILLCIGLNPSKAGAIINDPTVIRMMVRADKAGFGGLFMGNEYGYVSTNPDALLDKGDFVGADNDDYLKQMIGLSGRTMCGWGSFPAAAKRASAVLAMIPEPYCLGVNQDGQPKHPLYVGYDVPMVKYLLQGVREHVMGLEVKE